MECKLCNKEVENVRLLSSHLSLKHKNIASKEYYDKYLKKDSEGKCCLCEKDARYLDLGKGYHKICGSKECLGKTRATGTYQFLMYKYGFTEEEAKIEQQKRANERGIKIKEGLYIQLEKNSNFHKEKSHQSKEYWIKRGYSEEESIRNSKEVMDNIINKTIIKRHTNPENYTNVIPTQIGYWLKKGYNEEEAKQKLSERQSTFTLEKCIEKYGEKEGGEIFNKRQEKWKDSLIKNGNLKSGYSKISQELFYKILEYYEFEDRKKIYFATKNQEYFISIKKNEFYQYDFTDLNKMKIIEYNGDMYHANPEFYKEGDTPHPFRKNETFDYLREKDAKKIKASELKGFKVLTIWDSDYRTNPDEVLKTCLEFLDIKSK